MAETEKQAAIIGGGPAGLMAAEVLAGAGIAVTVYDAMPSVGRKFLLAGRGGLNLTHSEELPHFLSRYGAAEPHLRAAIEAFPPSALIAWCEALGQETFVGTSGRVFPKAMKASPLLRAWLGRLRGLGVAFRQRHRWRGWDEAGALLFDTPNGRVTVRADAAIFALGGASWPRLGSDGGWVPIFQREGIKVAPLKPSNCGFAVDFSDIFHARFEGEPLKGVAFSFEGRSVRGDATITKAGIEGGAIYALSASLRDALEREGAADLIIDLRPGIEAEALEAALSRPRGKQTLSAHLRKAAKLAPVAIGLLYEEAVRGGAPLADLDAAELVRLIKGVRVPLTAPAPIERAISSAGGVPFEELDDFMLRKKQGVFVAGEMLDYEAPTGGYLLQAAFSTGAAAAHGALAFVSRT
ncbi:NAD(FAD)-utilizing dehydrogenase [Rhodomicrobium udaipurense JA643]|uniref:TIGR03862 family flavoprotein n=1 Tax=Rhodomicrobium udaipurense TaxID=1202716 RepID=A0A8I1GBJ9_9HYPH|nr:TIGR03862 family flavoprotein [Rhodomicrobium udaipurense]KAI96077.1 NAD(FAD)-utilizing dehydrogenase [Rhodomicrobium udaipurense JA643]MBJ7542760.1 TIGR03862 family flavoprotein [Rhodomicrobium udaipurense]